MIRHPALKYEWYITVTQMTGPDAHRAFPCFNESAFTFLKTVICNMYTIFNFLLRLIYELWMDMR